MRALIEERQRAIELRKEGLTYREIRESIPVAKATLSLWFKSVSLSQSQQHKLTRKRYEAGHIGRRVWKRMRRERRHDIIMNAKSEMLSIPSSRRELFLMGLMLYWAEGSKQKEHNVSQSVSFANTDCRMAGLYVRWLREALEIEVDRIQFDIYIHAIQKRRENIIKSYWVDNLKISEHNFGKIYYKRHSIKTNRRKVDDTYFGLIKITVRRSTALNRMIEGWIAGISDIWGMV